MTATQHPSAADHQASTPDRRVGTPAREPDGTKRQSVSPEHDLTTSLQPSHGSSFQAPVVAWSVPTRLAKSGAVPAHRWIELHELAAAELEPAARPDVPVHQVRLPRLGGREDRAGERPTSGSMSVEKP